MKLRERMLEGNVVGARGDGGFNGKYLDDLSSSSKWLLYVTFRH